MTKEAMVERVAKEAKLTKVQAVKAINSILNSITMALKKGDKVTFVGFGTFSVRKRKARAGRNPQTGETMKIPAKKVPVFKAGAKLRSAIKQ